MKIRKYRFCVATEQHARQFAPLIKHFGAWQVYGDAMARRTAIDAVFKEHGIDDKVNWLSIEDMLDHIMTDKAYFVVPLHIGTPGHSRLTMVKAYATFIETPLSDLPSRVVMYNEVVYYPTAGFRPHAHAVFARTLPEVLTLQTQAPNTPVYLVGDLALDNYNPEYKAGANRIVIYTSKMNKNAKQLPAATITVQQMASDIEKAAENGVVQPSEILLKTHLGETASDYHQIFKNMADGLKITFRMLDRKIDVRDVCAEADIAVVQGSLTSHLHTRKQGVKSFFYYGDELGAEKPFFGLTGHPECHLSNPPDDKAYDDWVRGTFQLDGKVKERFLAALEEL